MSFKSSHQSTASGAGSGGGSSYGKSRYIWDEWGSDEEVSEEKPPVPLPATFLVPKERLHSDSIKLQGQRETAWSFPPPNGDGSASVVRREEAEVEERSMSSLGLESLASTVTSLQTKVSQLKKRLADKTTSIGYLQEELANLRTVKEKRQQRCESEAEKELAAQRAAKTAKLKKIRDFHDKLSSDLKKLQEQYDSLGKKCESFAGEKEVFLEGVRAQLQKKMSKARRQWEAEDQLSLQKALAAKEEMLKVSAANAQEPKLQAFVTSLKEAVERRRLENQTRLSKVRLELQEKLGQEVEKARRQLQEDLSSELARTEQTVQRRLADMRQAHSREVEEAREKWKSQLREAEREAEKSSAKESEMQRQALQAIVSSHNSTVQTLISEQQEQLSSLMQQHAQALRQEKERCKQVLAQQKQSLHSLRHQRQQDLFRKLLQQLEATILRERETIVAKLRADHDQAKQRRKEEIFAEADDLRSRLDDSMQTLKENERRSLERRAALRKEIEVLRGQLDAKKQSVHSQAEAKDSLRGQTEEVKRKLQTVEHDMENAKDDYSQRLSEVKKQLKGEEEEKREERDKLRKESSNLEKSLTDRKRELEEEYSNELSRIESKIAAVLKRKDDQLESLRRAVDELTKENANYQTELEALRDRAFA